jgi:hypothetical protein
VTIDNTRRYVCRGLITRERPSEAPPASLYSIRYTYTSKLFESPWVRMYRVMVTFKVSVGIVRNYACVCIRVRSRYSVRSVLIGRHVHFLEYQQVLGLPPSYLCYCFTVPLELHPPVLIYFIYILYLLNSTQAYIHTIHSFLLCLRTRQSARLGSRAYFAGRELRIFALRIAMIRTT